MDATATSRIRFNPFLPYWAVLHTDLRQTTQSWVYRLWVLMCALAAGGSVLYKLGIHRETGVVQTASIQTADLLRATSFGGLGLIALIAVSGISSERGSVGDAVLCRGISRYQYFLAKLHARLVVVVGTFVALSAGILAVHRSFFAADLTPAGCAVAVTLVALALTAVISCGVTVGALVSGTVTGITLFWLLLYGGILLLSLLPKSYPRPDLMLDRLHYILRGEYDPEVLAQVAGLTLGVSLVAIAVGLVGFGRKDV